MLKDIISTVKKNSRPPSAAIVTHLNELEKIFVEKINQYGVKKEDQKEGEKKEEKKNDEKLMKELKAYYD